MNHLRGLFIKNIDVLFWRGMPLDTVVALAKDRRKNSLSLRNVFPKENEMVGVIKGHYQDIKGML